MNNLNNLSDINNNNNKSDTSSVINIPKSKLKNLMLEYEAKNLHHEKTIEKLKNTMDTYMKGGNHDIKNNIVNNMEEKKEEETSISSIFKKKEKSDMSDKKIISSKEKSVISQQGGNKIVSHKSEDKKKHAKIKSESEKSDSSSEEETETSESESNSSSYENTSDIYHATETEDGINKAYSKLSREMEQISKMQRSGKMKGKEVVKRINFLLSGLQILDGVKKSNKKRK